MRRVLVFGGGGYLGRALLPKLRSTFRTVDAPSHADAPVEDPGAIGRAVHATSPDAIVNVAAARPQADREQLHRTNGLGASNVARVATAAGAHLLHVSTDCVLDGLSPAV